MKLAFIIYSLVLLTLSSFAQSDERCQQETEALKAYTNSLMAFKNSENTPYLELVREKNSINAELTLNNALHKITQEYYNYLNASSNPNIRKINNLQLFLQANAPAAHKMALATEMVGVLAEPEVTGNRSERFEQIKARLQNACGNNPDANYCKGLGGNFWQSLNPSGPSMAEGSHSSMIEHFIHITAASRDLGRNFIQNDEYNQIIQNDPNRNLHFTKVLSSALDEVAKNCANRDLLGGSNTKGGANTCLNVRLEDLTSDPNNVLTSSLSTSNNEISTLGDVVTSYFELMNTAKESQLKLTGEMVEKFSEYTSTNMASADQTITAESSQRNRDFNRLKQNLAGTIHGAFKLAASNNNLAAMLNGMDDANLNPSAADQLSVLNNATRSMLGYDQDLFKVDGDHITFDRAKLGELLVGDKINTVDLRNRRNELNRRLAAVNNDLESLKDKEGFSELETLQRFTWDNLRYHCSSDNMIDRDSAGDDPCSYRAGYNQGLESLMNAATRMSEIDEDNREVEQINSILSFCDNSENMPTQRDILNRTCSTAIARRSELQRQEAVVRREAEVRERLVNEDDRRYVYRRRSDDPRDGYERTGETRPRRNWVREGLMAGSGNAIRTLLPTFIGPPGIGYFQTRGSLLQAEAQAQQNITFNAWRAAQATYPQNNCHIYVCSFNSSVFGNTGLGVSRNYTGYAGFGTGAYGQTGMQTTPTIPTVDFSMPTARPTSP